MNKIYEVVSKIIFLSLICITISYGKHYCIREDYRVRTSYRYCDKRGDGKGESQHEVYLLALEIAKENNYKKIVDLGCGSGFKLINYFSEFETIGFEVKKTFDWLRKKHPNRRWELSDFNKPFNEPVDLVICSDVIEHILNPDALLKWISLLDCKTIVISTPDRTILSRNNPQRELGPSPNPFHIREWNFQEFAKYISQWFAIVDHKHMVKQIDCQVVVCTFK